MYRRRYWIKELALGAFLDIDRAFDRTSFDTITHAAERHGIEPTICRWICSMLESRNVTTTLSGETLRASTARRCPQGHALSPLLWVLVVDEQLLWELNDSGYYTVGYADDIAILINGKFPQTVSKVLQIALGTVQQWWDRTNWSINPNKTVIIPDIRDLKEPTPFNENIQLSSKVKYLRPRHSSSG
jgi:hypothetical protein